MSGNGIDMTKQILERYIHIPAVVYVICNDETFALFGLHGSIAGNGDDVHAKGSI